MKTIIKIGLLSLICFAIFSIGGTASAYQTSNAGSDLYLASGQNTTLQGSGYDSDGYSVNYYWSCNGGTLSSYNIAQPIYTAPTNNYNYQTSYICTLTVSNSYGTANSDSTTIYVNYGNNNSVSIQTTYATYVSNFQATLNATLSNANSSSVSYIYFQWGTTSNYGSETPRQSTSYSGTFIQNIANLNSGTTYHYRAVATGNFGTIYGQDMTFTTTGTGYYGSNALTIDKKVIDITSGNASWSTYINANPSDILSFSITIQAKGQDAHNVVIRDIIPSGLIYKGNLMVGLTNYGGDITSGLNIGTVYANQPIIVSYQAQVAPTNSFSYGANTINSSTTVSSNETSAQTDLATITVNKSLVYGATTISTGLTNNLITDSFLLPLLLIAICLWGYSSGKVNKFSDWLKTK